MELRHALAKHKAVSSCNKIIWILDACFVNFNIWLTMKSLWIAAGATSRMMMEVYGVAYRPVPYALS